MTQIQVRSEEYRRTVVVRIGDQQYALDARHVVEVIRPPWVTRVPHTPDALAGVANLRGTPLPVIDLRVLLNTNSKASVGSSARIVVYDNGGLAGLMVDEVIELVDAKEAHHLLDLDLQDRLKAAFDSKGVPAARRGQGALSSSASTDAKKSAESMALLSFLIAAQLYALPLQHVHEILAFPRDIVHVPQAEGEVLGLVSFRDGVLPIISLAHLLGLVSQQPERLRQRVVVVEYQNSWIGLAVDQIDALRRLPADAIDAVPHVLKRGSGTAELQAIGRINGGQSLISILSAERLFGHHAVAAAIAGNQGGVTMESTHDSRKIQEQFLLFTLGEELYGLPIDAIDEVIRVPDSITRLPNAPSFVTGVINLRSKALPLIDQRRRFETPEAQVTVKSRAIVLTIDGLQAGFIVDSASRIVAIPLSDVTQSPDFSSKASEVFDRVAQIEHEERMVLIVDPRELLSRAERDVIAAFAEEDAAVDT